MKIEKEDEGVHQRRKILVGIGFDKESKELLGWALVKVAEPQDHVVAVHVPRNSDASKEKVLMDDYLGIYRSLSDIKKVKLSGKILTGKSIRKGLVKEAKDCAAVAVIVGISKFGAIGGWVSTGKYCAKHLPPTTEIFTFHNGKIVFKRSSNDHTTGLGRNPKPSFHRLEKPSGDQSEFGDSELSEIDDSRSPKLMVQKSEVVVVENKYAIVESRKEAPVRSLSLYAESSVSEQRPGWPLLRRTSLPTQRGLNARKMSVVQWVMSLPDRTPPETPQTTSSASDFCSSKSESPNGSSSSSQSVWSELVEEPRGLPFESNSSDFTWFSYEVLRHATSDFSSDNLIGKGGWSRVYKGSFLDGKQVAVKVVKSSKEAWKDFSLEVHIMASLRHKNITPLLGVCIDNSEVISVYEFMSRGSLEENLHGENKQKSALPWEARFKVAVGIAESLTYLHNGCTRPVIHRDVKSSNILLSDDFEPQLSDFGLAMWGPNPSSLETYSDLVGTFGYLAPEYFMYGKVSDKLDVYSFGVVLLELLSGRKPIDSSKGQESLVMWGKPILESGKLEGLLDPILEGSFEESQMQRMVIAATLCLTRAARLRPTMLQILKLLKGEESVETWAKCHVYEQEKEEDVEANDDEVYQKMSAKNSHISLAFVDVNVEDDFTSCSSVEQSNGLCLEDYLKGRCSRSSSFD